MVQKIKDNYSNIFLRQLKFGFHYSPRQIYFLTRALFLANYVIFRKKIFFNRIKHLQLTHIIFAVCKTDRKPPEIKLKW